ncbi:MAG: molybdopterin-dependent oxidoreductase [Oscillospiraceae bacterium]|nr:molybdopterin-dependent oxidoreductase [Oscillospiraceae bacterium]
MKKSTRNILIALVFLAACALIFVNRGLNKDEVAKVGAKQLTVSLASGETVYDYSEESENYVTFDTVMTRKNGDKFDKNYSGIQVKDILADLKVELTDKDNVVFTCADNYEVKVSAADILTDGNVYLVSKESGEENRDNGVFMLVINGDEFSTRWAKNVVKVSVVEE